MSRCLVVLVLLSAAFAQQPAPAAQQPAAPNKPSMVLPADQQASHEDIVRLFEALHLQQTMENLQEAMMTNMQQLLNQTPAKDSELKLSPAQRQKLEAFRSRSNERARNLYPIKEMLEDFVPVYQRYFTKSDVDVLIAFYSSPAGKRFLAVQPELTREGMAALMPKTQERLQKYSEETRRKLDEIFKTDDETKSAPKDKKKS